MTKRYTTPFGAPRGAKPQAWPDDKAFLGKPADTTTGLTHIGAREYDPNIGRFISVDPVMDLTDPQQINGYTYANNTPVTMSDPTGTCPEEACQGRGPLGPKGAETATEAADTEAVGTPAGGTAAQAAVVVQRLPTAAAYPARHLPAATLRAKRRGDSFSKRWTSRKQEPLQAAMSR
ncbi:RHS repeat-associated core domain-containing protein [Streptomyces sp. FXJ1.4098]|nr:RHS repeat-associated core domain-containing protein [Streptomyces sp. FXJ1.4098]